MGQPGTNKSDTMKFFVLFLISQFLTATWTLLCPDTCICVPTAGQLWHFTCSESLEDEISLTWNSHSQMISITCDQNPVFNLTQLLSNFGLSKQINAVFLQSCPLPSKPFAQFLENINVTELYFTAPADRPLGSVNADLFMGLDLQKLGLGRNGLFKVPFDLLSNNKHLTFVDLSANQLDTIPMGFFNSSPLLTVVNMASNHLRVLNAPLGHLPHLKTLYLHNNELVSISGDAFSGLKNLQFLDLQGNYLEQIDPDTFTHLVNLKELRLFSNRLGELPAGLLRTNSRLNFLDLHDNPVLQLPQNLVANHTYLRKLNIAGCNLSSLPPYFLQNLHNVTNLDFSLNNLQNLDENLFKDVAQLVSLTLAHNRLATIPAKILRSQTKLEQFDISHNRLINISDETFENAHSLLNLDMSHNRLIQLENPFNGDTRSNLTTLRINNNVLTSINRHAFIPCIYLQILDLSINQLEAADFQLPQRLVKLNMSHNALSEMPLTLQQWLQNLQNLDFSHNRIKMLSAPNLQFYSDQVTIDLQHNNISTIDLSLEQFLTSSSNGTPIARLGFNPINCDCHIRYLLTHMRYQLQDRDVIFRLDVQNLPCASPPSLRGKEITTVTESDLFCTVHENCPEPCQCLLRTEGFVTEVRCPPNSVSEIPSIAPINTTIVDLSKNNISSLDGIQDPHWSNLSVLILTDNKLSSLDVDILPQSLTALHVDGNKFERLNPETLDSLLTVRSNLLLWLGNNPWLCDCADSILEPWLELTANVKDVHRMECANLPNVTVARYDCEEWTNINAKLIAGLVIIAIFLTILISFAGIAYYKYLHEIRVWLYSHQWCMYLVSEKDVDADKQFDAFISFSQEDMDWVATNLMPGLEQHEPHYRLCIHHRDWLVGEWIPDQIVRSVEDSCRTIVVLSTNFIRSVWGRLEFKTAHHQALQDRMNRVIVIVLGEVPPKDEMDPDMRMYVGLNTYLRWEDPWFWKKLRYAMPHKPVGANDPMMTTVIPKGKKHKRSSDIKVKTTTSL
uniref:TIR domain-containing protein n=1 Tax=Strigamia maritima TaxID=126957 RepID=T1JC97_STRMM